MWVCVYACGVNVFYVMMMMTCNVGGKEVLFFCIHTVEGMLMVMDLGLWHSARFFF